MEQPGQNRGASTESAAADLVRALEQAEERIVEVVVGDVTHSDDDPARLRDEVAAAVRWAIDGVRPGASTGEARLAPLRAIAADAARRGVPVGRILDRYLSAGWAVWERAAAIGIDRAALVDLGAVLLRAGDAAAAAIADAYGVAEREVATRSASARREFLDTLLAYRPGDPSVRRLIAGAATHGLSSPPPVRVLIAATGADLDDGDPLVGRVARELGPRATLVATDRGRLLAVLRPTLVSDASARDLLDAVVGPGTWHAVAVTAPGLTDIGVAAADVHASLDIAVLGTATGRVLAPSDVLLERAMGADPPLLEAAAAATLAPLRAGRGGDRLVETLRVLLESGGNRREAARRLGLAPRTVTYRLARIEELLGVRIAGPALVRLAAAIFALDLVGRLRRPETGPTAPPRRGPG